MNTLKRKLTAILLTFAMLFSLMPALPQAAEAAEPTSVQSGNGYITFGYEHKGTAKRNIKVNVYMDGSLVDSASVDDARSSDNQLWLEVNDKDAYEIAGADGVQ